MRWELADKALDSEFLRTVELLSGQNVSECYQCGKCSSGCPALADVELSPNRVLRMTQLGLEDDALDNEMIWSCAGCGTCTGRCPEGIDVGRVFDALRAIAERRGIVHAPGATQVRTFYRAFLDCVREFGRNSEVGLMAAYNISSGRLMTNVVKAPWFLLKTKISFTAHKVKRIDRMKRVFQRIEEIEEAQWEKLGVGAGQ